MKSSDEQLNLILWQFCQSYINAYQEKIGGFPQSAIDPESSSPCEIDRLDENTTTWQPIKIEQSLDFNNISSALDIEIHPDIHTYFCNVYANSIPVISSDGKLSLLFSWNFEDFQRLQENVIGHIMMKQRLKQAVTIFFAVTDEEDMIISINNDSGAIWAERIGCEPHKKLADSMSEFISNLSFDFS